ncbi:hypothetical protein I4F81_004986 [Pyropia yezoensis]|uniref:Uncharacterized protein n=1 Tax=Pyropia yezoensis TaxID=2788 RepID=A0ACC3BWZ2_PYRYE|nr:hypothetical protein I4F81_004986 [Neopyropia yezoensis]
MRSSSRDFGATVTDGGVTSTTSSSDVKSDSSSIVESHRCRRVSFCLSSSPLNFRLAPRRAANVRVPKVTSGSFSEAQSSSSTSVLKSRTHTQSGERADS